MSASLSAVLYHYLQDALGLPVTAAQNSKSAAALSASTCVARNMKTQALVGGNTNAGCCTLQRLSLPECAPYQQRHAVTGVDDSLRGHAA